MGVSTLVLGFFCWGACADNSLVCLSGLLLLIMYRLIFMSLAVSIMPSGLLVPLLLVCFLVWPCGFWFLCCLLTRFGFSGMDLLLSYFVDLFWYFLLLLVCATLFSCTTLWFEL
jgi:hypothetical protein